MDTLTILEKLKKKRPDLKEDPLMLELEMGIAGEGAEEDAMEGVMEDKMAFRQAKPGPMSYLDEEADAEAGMAEGEMEQADALMEGLDAEEGMDTEADAMAAGAKGDMDALASYLDEEDEEEDMPTPAPKAKGRRTRMSPRGTIA